MAIGCTPYLRLNGEESISPARVVLNYNLRRIIQTQRGSCMRQPGYSVNYTLVPFQ